MTIRRRLFGAIGRVFEGAPNDTGKVNEAERVAWLNQALQRIPPGSRILDAGAGEQRFKPFCAHLKYVSQDFGMYEGKGDGRGLQTGSWDQTKLDLVCDITQIPEPDHAFDAIMCIEVLEHLPDPVSALREFSRLLCSGGQLIITAPFCSLTHFAPYHFSTGFNRYFYEHHLPALGFNMTELTPNGNYFEYLAQEIRRLPAIAMECSGTRLGPLERLAAAALLRTLRPLSLRDRGSAELLNYGYHVRAVKK